MRYASSLLLIYAHLSGLLARCGRGGDLRLHATVVKNPYHFRLCASCPWLRHVLVAWNPLVAIGARCDRREDASRVFDEMRLRDAVSWNSLLAASRGAEDAFAQFRRMLREGAAARACDRATFTTVLSACARSGVASLPACAMVHGLVVSCGFEAEVAAGNALVAAYFECGSPGSAEGFPWNGREERRHVDGDDLWDGARRAVQGELHVCFGR